MRFEFPSAAFFGAGVALAFGAIVAGIQPASAQSLIVAPPAERIARAPLVIDGDRRVKRHRMVEIDGRILAGHVAPDEADAGSDRAAAAARLDGLVELEMFPGIAGLFKREHVTVASDGALEWDGDLIGSKFGAASLRIKAGQVFGQVQIGSRTFRIEPFSGGLHVIKEFDTESLPGDIVVPVPGRRSAAPSPVPARVAQGRAVLRTRIDVLVAYTTKARNASASGITNEIASAIQLANTAYRQSGVRISLRLVRQVEAVGYDEDAVSYNQNLYDLSYDPPLAGIRTQRETYGADLVVLIREAGAYCGIGWMPTTPGSGTSHYGFSVTTRSCITNHTFAHELGHNMGLNHDRYVVSSPPTGSYNYGYVNTVDRVRTVMAYGNRCTDLGFSCTRVPFFSTPNRLYNGSVVIGLPTSSPEAAFAAQRLNETRRAIARYRSVPADALADTTD